ncbi:MAG: helix-turn-helix domain-containing protein [Thermoleophilia bacterium]
MTADTRELAFLERLALAAASVLDPDELMELVISETTEALRVDVCSIFLLDEADQSLRFVATNGLSGDAVGNLRLRMGEGVTGWAARERRPVVVEDVSSDEHFRWVPGVDERRFTSMCSVPILTAGRLVGVINVQTERRRAFAEDDLSLIGAIGAQVGGVIERAELQRRLERRVEELQVSDEIHRRLSELALSGATLTAICGVIGRYARGPVAVYDADGGLLAADAPAAVPEVLRGFVDPERRDDGLSVLPVRAGGDGIGWLAVGPDPSGAAGSARRMALDHGLTVVALHLVQERAAAETESRLRGGLLQELLTATLPAAEARRLARRAARLGYRLRSPIRVAVLEPDDSDSAHAISQTTAQRRVRRGLESLLEQARPGGLVAEQGPDFVLLLPDDGHGLDDAEDLAERARATAAAASGAGVSAGVSAGAGGPEDLSRLAREAREAIRIGRGSGGGGRMHSHARLGVERLLLQIDRREELSGFVDQWLGPLERHQRGGRGAAPLLGTLEALAAESWNLRAAARRLHVHVNTLMYRMGRIEEVTGRALDDPDTRIAMGLALKARRMVDLDERTEPLPVLNRTMAPYPFGWEGPSVPTDPTEARR